MFHIYQVAGQAALSVSNARELEELHGETKSAVKRRCQKS